MISRRKLFDSELELIKTNYKIIMKKSRLAIGFMFACLVVLTLASCYQHRGVDVRRLPKNFHFTERTIDSLSFFSTHHYTNNYNFVVRGDSLVLLKQQPEEYLAGMQTDSFAVYKGDHVVVADICMVPADSIDSVWVELANDTSAFGWTRESNMLPKVMPDDPISEFISDFSNSHLIIFLAIVALFGAGYLIWKMLRKKAYIVHFHEIDSFYPTFLCLLVSASATFYATIQMFFPTLWQHFYFHPTLNPFSVPPVLSAFLFSVWAMVVVAIAALDDVSHHLPAPQAILYIGGLAAVCAIDYIVFSVSTLYYVGYLLLIAYICFAVRRYLKNRTWYYCGNCGHKLHHKGRCPYCGAVNE